MKARTLDNKGNVMSKSREYIVVCLAFLALFLSGCQAEKKNLSQIQASRHADSHVANDNDVYFHPFFEQSLSKPHFDERPEKRYGTPPRISPLPEKMLMIEPVTLTIETRLKNKSHSIKSIRKVTRSANRIHLNNLSQGHQWFFIQNQKDPRRFFGQLVDVNEKVILEYHESDLADAGIGHGWSDIVGMGVPLATIQQMQPTNQTEEKFGITFQKYISLSNEEQTQERVPSEIWWSERHFLPLRITSHDGSFLQEIVSINTKIDVSLLEDPRERYLAYVSIDKADWKSCDTNHYGLPRVKHNH
jgi:hypothetical protein